MHAVWSFSLFAVSGAIAGWWAGKSTAVRSEVAASVGPIAKEIPQRLAVESVESKDLAELQAFIKSVRSGKTEDFAGMWKQTSNDFTSPTRTSRQFAILYQVRERQPATLPEYALDPRFGGDAIQLWARLDPQAVFDWAEKAPKESASKARGAAMDNLANKDPESAIAQASTKYPESTSVAIALRKLAQKNFSAAQAHAEVYPSGKGRVAAWRALAGVKVKDEGIRALDWARELKTKTDRDPAIEVILMGLLPQELDVALAALKDLRKSGYQGGTDVKGAMADAIALRDPLAAIAWVKDPANQVEMFDFVISRSLIYKLKFNPTARQLVDIFAEANHTNPDMPGGVNEYLRQWKPENLFASITDVVPLPACPGQTLVLDALFSQVGSHLSEMPAGFLESLPDAAKSRYLLTVGRKLREEGRGKELAELYAMIPDPSEKKEAFGLQAENFSVNKPEQAEAFFSGVPNEFKKRAAFNLVQGLAQSDYSVGEEFIARRPADQQGELYYNMVRYAARNGDSQMVSEQVKAMPAGPVKDYAISGLVDGVVTNDPASAMIWAAAIGDPKDRIYKIAHTLGKIQANRSQSGVDAYFQLGLSIEEQQAVTKTMKELNAQNK